MNEVDEENLINECIAEIKGEHPQLEVISFLMTKNLNNFLVSKIAFRALRRTGNYVGLHDLQRYVFEYEKITL